MAPELITVDFALRQNQLITGLMFLLSGFFYYTKMFVWSGTVLFIMGLLFAVNGINLIISIIFMGVGVIFLTKKE